MVRIDLRVIDRDFRADCGWRAIRQRGAQVRHQLGTLEHHETVVKRVALVGFGKTAGDHTRNAFELQRRGGLLATGATAKVESANHDIAAADRGC